MRIRTYVASYTIETCKMDIAAAQALPSAQRGAQITVAKKKLKAGIVLEWLHRVKCAYDLDITPTFANRLVKGWIDRSISRKELTKHFSVPGRTAANKSVDAGKLGWLIAENREAVQLSIKKATEKL